MCSRLNLAPGTLLLPYYGGAKGQYLVVTRPWSPQPAVKKNKKKGNKKPGKPGKPGNKEEEEEEEEENVGEEVTGEDKPPAPPTDSSDTVTIGQPPPNASMAEAKPIGIAIAGEGGVASSRPSATALVGPGGLAVARPIATAIAGIQGAELLLAGAGPPSAHAAPSALFLPLGIPLGPSQAQAHAAHNPQLLGVYPATPALHGLHPLHALQVQPAHGPAAQWVLYAPPPHLPYF